MFIPGRLAGQRVEGEHGKWLSRRDSKGTGNVNPQDGKKLKRRLGRAATWLSGAHSQVQGQGRLAQDFRRQLCTWDGSSSHCQSAFSDVTLPGQSATPVEHSPHPPAVSFFKMRRKAKS